MFDVNKLNTGNFYYQLNTGRGFTDNIAQSGDLFAQRTDYHEMFGVGGYSTSGCYRFGLVKEKTRSFTDATGKVSNKLTLYGGADAFIVGLGYTSSGNSAGLIKAGPQSIQDELEWNAATKSFVVGTSGLRINNTGLARNFVPNIISFPNLDISGNYPPDFVNCIQNSRAVFSWTLGSYISGSHLVSDHGGIDNCIYNTSCSHVLGSQYSCMNNTCNSIIIGATAGEISCADKSTVLAGFGNRIIAQNDSFIGGGYNNKICNFQDLLIHQQSAIVAGHDNCVNGGFSTIIGGVYNQAGTTSEPNESYNAYLAVIGALCGRVVGYQSTIIGGANNLIRGFSSTILGGICNYISVSGAGQDDSVLNNNRISGDYISQRVPESAFIGGGIFNCILRGSLGSAILAGDSNTIVSGNGSVIVGGEANSIYNADGSFILGSRGYITGFGSFTGIYSGLNAALFKLKGVGIISDGSRSIVNTTENSLNINYLNGITLTPGINIKTENQQYDFIDDFDFRLTGIYTGISGRRVTGLYHGYTGVVQPPTGFDDFGLFRSISLGDDNIFAQYSDFSGFNYTGKKLIYRRYNPSILLGHSNYGGYLNTLIGHGNSALYQTYEQITGSLTGTTGLAPAKTINLGAPWPFLSDNWPYFQGNNIIVGNFNVTTGASAFVLGTNNLISEASSSNIMVGNYNNLYKEGTSFLTGAFGVTTGIRFGTGITTHFKTQNLILGFNNAEYYGEASTILGGNNTSWLNGGIAFGNYNDISGREIFSIGHRNISKGSVRSLIFGYGNTYSKNISGAYNHTIGFYNRIENTGSSRNNIFGEKNVTNGLHNLILGSTNIVSDSGNNVSYSNIAIGHNNDSYGAETTIVGKGNYVPFNTSNNIVIGDGHTVSGVETLSVGFNSNVAINTTKSYSFGGANSINSNNSLALGNQAAVRNYGQISIASDSFTSTIPGSTQKSHLFWKGIVTGASEEILLDGVYATGNYISGKALVPSGVVWIGTLNVVCVETGGANGFVSQRTFAARNNQGTVAILTQGTNYTNIFGVSPGAVVLSADTVNRGIQFTVTNNNPGKVLVCNIEGEFTETFIPTRETIYRKEYNNNQIFTKIIASGNDLY